MLKSYFALAALLSLAFAFSGCATTWSDHDKARLASVAVNPVQVGKDAYRKPDATDSPGMAESIPTVTGGGLLPSLIGSAIDATVMAKQQKKFEAANAQHFDALAARMTTPPAAELGAALKQALSAHDFFGSRLAETSATAFTAEIISYGLQKSPLSQNDDILLRVRIIARINLVLPDKQALWTAQIGGVASTAKHASEILDDPNFITRGIQEATEDFCEQAVVLLNEKLKPRR